MSLLFVISLAAFCINLGLSTFVLGLGARNAVNRSFSALSGVISLWMLCVFISHLPVNEDIHFAVIRIMPLFFLSVGILTLNFTYMFLRKKPDMFFFLHLTVYIVFLFISLSTDMMAREILQQPGYKHMMDGMFFRLSLFMAVGLPVLHSMFLLIKKAGQTVERISYKQTRFTILGQATVIPALLAFFLPLSPGHYRMVLIMTGPVVALTYSLFIFIAIIRWRFLYTRIDRASQELFANVNRGVIITDVNAATVRINDFAMKLFEIDKNRADAFRIRDYIPDYEFDRQYDRHEFMFKQEISGRKLYLSLTQSHIIFRKYRIGTLLIISDITENKINFDRLQEAIEEARSASTAKSTFLANMSHELRTPLNSIIGFSQLLFLEGESLSGEQLDYIENINKSGNHLLAMVNDLLDQSRIESGTIKIKKEKFDIKAMLSQFPVTIKPLIDEKNLHFHLNINDNMGIIVADILRINQIIYNLMSNAIKFTDPGKSIGLDAHGEDDRILIEVWDQGPGISIEEQEQIFEPFVQVGDPSIQLKGSGLGLSITKHLIDLHDGRLELISEPGNGSRFIITLPGRLEDKRSRSRDDSGDRVIPVYRSERKLKILVVEDNMVNMKLISSILKTLDHQAVCVQTGEDAINMVISENHDLVLMDIQLPGIDGTTAMRRIKKLSPDTPVIAITACAMKEETELLMSNGFDAYLPKPLSVRLLHETINLFAEHISPAANQLRHRN